MSLESALLMAESAFEQDRQAAARAYEAELVRQEKEHPTIGVGRGLMTHPSQSLKESPVGGRSNASTRPQSSTTHSNATSMMPTPLMSPMAASNQSTLPSSTTLQSPRVRKPSIMVAPSFDQITLHPFQPAVAASPYAAAGTYGQQSPQVFGTHSSPYAPSPLTSNTVKPDQFASNLKATDPYSLYQYLEEARLAYQYGRYPDALTIYSYLEGLKVSIPNLGFHISCCRRHNQQELLAIASLTAQLKQNEHNGIDAYGRNQGRARDTSDGASVGGGSNESSESVLPHLPPSQQSQQPPSAPNDPDFIAPSLVCEWERMFCWAALHEADHVKRSLTSLRRMMDSTSWHPEIDNTFACWMAMAKWLANHGYDHEAQLALEQAREVIQEEDPSLGRYVNESHWLLLSAYVAWSLGDYESVAAISQHLSSTPQSILAPLSLGDDGVRALDETQVKMTLFHIGSCLVTADVTSQLNLEVAVRMIDSILNHPARHSADTLATAYRFKANAFLLRGSLRPAVACLKQVQACELRMTEDAAASPYLMTTARFPFFGPIALANQTTLTNAPLPLASGLCMYDLRRSMDSWTARNTRLPPNFEVIVATGGLNPIHASSRYLSVLLDFYSELLLKYGIHDPRLLFYRSNLWAALGNTRMQLHDLDILLATAPQWFSQYVAAQTSCDWNDFQSTSCPLSRVCVVNILNLHLVASSYSSTLMDKNVASSAANLVALQRQYYQYLLKIPSTTAAANSSTAPTTTANATASTNSSRVPPHLRNPSSTSLPSRSSTSFSTRPPTVQGSRQTGLGAEKGSLVAAGDSSWDFTPMSGLLECEEALFYEAIVADLTRQHASSYSSLANTNAMLLAAQESFETILKQVHTLTTNANAISPVTASSSAAAPSSTVLPIVHINTSLICVEGLALIHTYRLRFNVARHTVLDGLARAWSEVDRLIALRQSRMKAQKTKLDQESKGFATVEESPRAADGRPKSSTAASRVQSAKRGLSATQIIASNAPFHIKALKLTAPLLTTLAEDPNLSELESRSGGNDEESEGTLYSELSYWSLETPRESTSSHRSKGTNHATQTTLEWLEPSRLLMNTMRRHCAILLSILGISYMMEANTDTSLLLFYRSLAIDATEYFANLYLFYHHFRFSPLNLCMKHYMTVYEHVPYFIPNMESINISPLRYPLIYDTAFSGSFQDPNATADEDHNPFEPSSSNRNDGGPSKGTSVNNDSTLAYPFPKCHHRCLTTRLMDRPYTHTASPELSLYLQSLSSHVQAMKHKNEVGLKLHKQHELVERYKTEHGLPGAKKAIDENAPGQATEYQPGSIPLILSLNNLHPYHPYHPYQQRQKKGLGNIEEELKNFAATKEQQAQKDGANTDRKPNKPTGAPKGGASTARSNKVVKKDSTATTKPGGKKSATDTKLSVAFNLNDFTSSRTLPQFIHVEHRPYQPNVNAITPGHPNAWSALQWYKESLKLLSFYDKTGVLFCFLKCLHLDIDYCASLNYVLSLLETNLTEHNVTFASVQMMRDMKEIEALEAAANGENVPSSPSSSNPSSAGINKHTYESLAAMFGREKVLPIIWDVFIRGKQYEEFYGNIELTYSEYTYALQFLSLGDVLWRRGLIEKSRGNVHLALVDISEAIKSTLSDQSLLEKIPQVKENPMSVRRKWEESKSQAHMTEKERKELAQANAIAANAHTPAASIAIVKQKLEIYHLIRGLIFYNQGNFSSAALDASECLAMNSKNPVGLRLLSLCQTYLAKYDDAILHLEKYLEVLPKDLGSRLRLGNLLSFVGNHDKAMKQFDKILHYYAPQNVEVLYAKGLAYYRQHAWHDSHDLFSQCIALSPKFWLAYMRLGEVLERLESYELAIETLKLALKGYQTSMFPSASEDDFPIPPTTESQSEGYIRIESFHLDYIHRTMGRIYLSQAQQAYMGYLSSLEEERKTQAKRRKDSFMRHGDQDSSHQGGESKTQEDVFPSAPPTQPPATASGVKKDNWSELLTSTQTELAKERVASAKRQQTIRSGRLSTEEIHGKSSGASGIGGPNVNKTVSYVSKCLYQAFQSLQQSIQDIPGKEDPESYYLLAITILFLGGNRNGGLGGSGKDLNHRIWILLDKVVQLEPKHIDAHFLRGFLLQRDNRMDEAAAEYDLVLSLDSEHLLALQARGYLYFLKDERSKSYETYTQMLNHPGPLRAVAYANRGLVSYIGRNYYAALNDLDYAISAQPHHALAYLYRAETHKALAFMNESIQDYRQAAPMVKQKLDEAESERKYFEQRSIANLTKHRHQLSNSGASGGPGHHLRNSTLGLASSFNFATAANSPNHSRPSTTAGASSGSANDSPMAASPHGFGSSEAKTLPNDSPRLATEASSAPLNLANLTAASAAASSATHPMAASSTSLPLSLPSSTSVILAAQQPGAQERITSIARWKGIKKLILQSLLKPNQPTVPLSAGLGTNGTNANAADGSNLVGVSMRSVESQPSIYDMESLQFHPIQGGEHFRMVASPLATSYQSEVGLTTTDLDSIHNSLGILLHQRAALKKKALAHAPKHQKGGLDSSKMNKLVNKTGSMSLTLAAQLAGGDSSNSSHAFASPITSTTLAVAAADAEDEEALFYFSTDSTQFQAHYNRALIFLEKGSLHTALGEFKHAVDSAPDFANGQNNYGVVLQKMGQIEEAAKHYTEALKLTGHRHLIAAFNLANTKVSTNQYQAAIRLYTIFLKRVTKLQRDARNESKLKKNLTSNTDGTGGSNDAKSKAGGPHSPSKLKQGGNSMRYESIHLEESESGSLNTGKNVEFLPKFERDLIELQEKEEAEAKKVITTKMNKKKSTSALATTASSAQLDISSPSKSVQSEPAVPSLANQEDSNLIALLPLALNNRAICYQNLGKNHDALRGYSEALLLNPTLSYIKFNRAHLYMVMGNCFDALEDIKDYSREQAAKSFKLDAERNPSLDGRLARAKHGAKNAIERMAEGPAVTDSSSGSSGVGAHESTDSNDPTSSLSYLSNFYDYCKRYQWGLSVATKDLLTGIRTMPILSNLNLNLPVNPGILFNPLMLNDSDSLDWKRLKWVIDRLTITNEMDRIMQMELEDKFNQDVKARAILPLSSNDPAYISHIKEALKFQVEDKFKECLDMLLKTLYLLPPTTIFMEQQKREFVRRYGLNVNTVTAVMTGHPSIQPPELYTELLNDLCEILIIWRARLQVYLGAYDSAVEDLEFYVGSFVEGSNSTAANAALTKGRKRRNKDGTIVIAPTSGMSALEDEFGSDVDEDDAADMLLLFPPTISTTAVPSTTNSAGGTSLPSPTSAPTLIKTDSKSPSHALGATSITTPNLELRVDASPRHHDFNASTLSYTSQMSSSPSHYRTAEEEAIYQNQLALFQHRHSQRSSRILTYLGSLYHFKHRDADALRVYTLAIQIDGSTNIYPLLNRSLVARLQGRYSNAIQDLFQVLKLIASLDEQERVKDRERREAKEAGSGEAEIEARERAQAQDPYYVPSEHKWKPSIETGLAPPSSSTTSSSLRLKLTMSQKLVHQVLLRYGEVLQLNPQESWDAITGLQGQLATAVDSVLAERSERKKKTVDVEIAKKTDQGGVKLIVEQTKKKTTAGHESSSESSSEDESQPSKPKTQKLSAADASNYFREQLDSAADQLMEHLIDPKLARDKEAANAQAKNMMFLPTQLPTSLGGGGKMLSSNLARAEASSAGNPHLPSTGYQPPTTKSLDASFNNAFANMNSLISSQLPKKMLARPVQLNTQSSSSLIPAAPGVVNPLVAPAKTTFKAGEPSLNTDLPLVAANTVTLASGPSLPSNTNIPVLIDPRSNQSTDLPPSTQLSVLINNLSARAKVSPPVDFDSSSTSSLTGSVRSGAQPPTGKKGVTGRKPAAATGSKTHRPPKSSTAASSPVTPSTPNQTESDDAAFLAVLDPSLPAVERARLLEERRLKRIAAVREKFAGHGRSESYYGLLTTTPGSMTKGDATSSTLPNRDRPSPSSSLATLTSVQAHQLQQLEFEEAEQEEFDSLSDDDDD